ncbi:MAG: preprotein translocase subunit SecG [Candidatus Komeilibacteria bacterium]|nr:preprotein translocase subunit SecG [Candidatus Komeilibacteria bacterium]
MQNIISIIQIILAILLMVAVLLQSRGSGLGAAFGGEGAVYRTKRGAEKILFVATIVLSVLFLGITLAEVFIRS